ncbi:MAG TPA: asparagine synthase-related protein [Thermoplasmata archaeon]|nr:asparagine synthase-related protein [Thermoplasmata archaeon]
MAVEEAAEQDGGPRIFERLDRWFSESLDRAIEGAREVTVLFSGGVDSALVATALRGRIPITLFAWGLVGSRDLETAGSSARLLGLPVTRTLCDLARFERLAHEIAPKIPELPEPSRSVQLAMAMAVREAVGDPLVTGQGADELFGGYAHFRGLSREAAGARRQADLRRLLEVDWPLSRRIADGFGRSVRSPFLEEPFLSNAASVPLSAVPPNGPTKPLLRAWAVRRGIPREIAERPKLAMQYGTGVARARRRGDRPTAPP